MIFQMIEAIARDGNFMLNIGLTPEGELEPGGVRMWEDFGEFTKRNALAIYGSSAWKILGEDGSENSGVLGADVTARLREMISAHRLEFTVGVPVFGSDPAPGVPKLLKVSYRLDGQVGSMAKAENEAFVLAGVESLEILEARFVPDVSQILPRSFPSGPIIREHAEFGMSTKDVRFTHGKDGAVYVFVMAVPEPGERLRIRALGHSAGFLDRPVRSVSLLGSDANFDWSQEPDGLVLTYPKDSGFPFAVVFRVE